MSIIKSPATFTSSYYLTVGAERARAVGRLVTRAGMSFGTGFLISKRLLMTTGHVLDDRRFAERSCVEFGYVRRFDGSIGSTQLFKLLPSEFFLTSESVDGLNLDYALVAVEAVNPVGHKLAARGYVPLTYTPGETVVTETVNIIQHPGGDCQQVALRNNKVVKSMEHFIHYEADTMRGSSGSPVFNDQWQLIALHHSGVPDEVRPGVYRLRDGDEWDTRLPLTRLQQSLLVRRVNWIANEGVRISSIVEDARARISGDDARLALFEEAVRKVEPQFSEQTEAVRADEVWRPEARFNENPNITSLVESLRRHGVEDKIIASVLAEIEDYAGAAYQIIKPAASERGLS